MPARITMSAERLAMMLAEIHSQLLELLSPANQLDRSRKNHRPQHERQQGLAQRGGPDGAGFRTRWMAVNTCHTNVMPDRAWERGSVYSSEFTHFAERRFANSLAGHCNRNH